MLRLRYYGILIGESLFVKGLQQFKVLLTDVWSIACVVLLNISAVATRQPDVQLVRRICGGVCWPSQERLLEDRMWTFCSPAQCACAQAPFPWEGCEAMC